MTRRSLIFLLVLSAAIGLFGAGAARASWERVQVQVITIHYTTHDGFRRDAYVVLPEWYGPWSNPPLPLIISPHGRGVSAEENVDRWGDLPALGSFAVVNPEGQGRRLENFTRVETFGDNAANGLNDVHWVKVLVDPSSRDVFAFQPQIVPANRVAVPAP